MSEMTSVEHQQQDQQYVGNIPNTKYHCKDCNMFFDSNKSLEVHLHYHHDRLMGQWGSQDESNNNNNSKAGNHNNSHVKRESITAPADSSESTVSTRPQSAGSTTSHQLQQQQVSSQVPQQQPPSLPSSIPPPPSSQSGYSHFQMPMFSETSYFMQNEQSYILPHYSPNHDDQQNPNTTNYAPRFHPYQHQHHFVAERANSVSSTSPRSPLQCDKCGGVFDDPNQLSEHIRSNHPTSPSGYTSQPQYQQLGETPHNQQQQVPSSQTQLHSSPPQNSQPPAQSGYEYNGNNGVQVKLEIKQEQEEQSEILDLDSHKVQTHRYEEEIMRIQQQQQQQHQQHQQQHHQQQQQQHQEMQIQHQNQRQHQHAMQQQQQRVATHSVSSMLGWPPTQQPHEYHPGLSPMGPIDSSSPIPDQSQFIRGKHMPIEPPRHAVSPIITSTQPIPTHQMPAGILQTSQKSSGIGNQSWKSNEARRPKTYNCTACNKWFTSSGHLKRHYNTTLHKNAVKQSNLPDPANMPISAHHHPGRDSHGNPNRNNGSSRSPELSTSSVSPPNLMAGPSVEAARGLLHTPTNHFTTSNSSNSSTNSNDSTSQVQQSHNNNHLHHHHLQQQQQQTVHHQGQSLVQQQQQHHHHHQQQQQQEQQRQQASSTTAVHMVGNTMVGLNSPVSSPMAVHQQMGGSPSPQLGQHQHHHHLSIGSPSQLVPSHHPMNSPMHPPTLHQHLNSPSPMATTPTPTTHHHPMNSPSPIMAGVTSMVSPPMGGITMPHQPYPNGLPPHVTTTTSIPGLLESITSPQTTIGNNNNNNVNINNNNNNNSEMPSQSHLHIAQDMLPGFGTFNNHQRTLPSFTQFADYLVGHNQSQAVNVGGLSPEDSVPQERSFESPSSNYNHQQFNNNNNNNNNDSNINNNNNNDSTSNNNNNNNNNSHQHQQDQDEQHHHNNNHHHRRNHNDSPTNYQEPLSNMIDPLHITNNNDDTMMIKQFNYLPQHQQQNNNNNNNNNNDEQDEQQYHETNNNNLPSIQGKEEVNPNVVKKRRGRGAGKKNNIINKEQDQVSSTNSVVHFISEGGIHKCIDCNKNFNKACYLTQHNKSFHSGDKPFKCNQCGKRFPLEHMHEEHLSKHAGDKPYKCGECPKQFNHKTDLRRHQCLHTGEKPYACDTCGKGFIRKDHMMKHLDTHKKKQIHNIHLRT